MQLTSTLLLAAAAISSVAAHPSPAAHRHARFHDKNIEARDNKFVKNVKPVKAAAAPAVESTPAPAPAPAASTPSPKPVTPAKADESASSGSGSGTGVKKQFCAGSGASKRATAYDIAYKGNTGTADNWGCNIMEIDCGDLDLYDYTAKFTSTGGDTTYACSAFNKIGPTGLIDGFWHSALDFSVSAAGAKCLAFDSNSQGGVACGAGSVPKTSIGQFAGTWLEFDAGSSKNDNQSGSDVSIIVAENFGLTNWISMSIDAPGKGTCSRLSKANPSLDLEVYKAGMEDLDGVGCTGYSTGTIFITLGD